MRAAFIHEQVVALLSTSTLVSVIDLAKTMGMTPNNLAGRLRQRVVTGELVREVKRTTTGPARLIGFYRLATDEEIAARTDVAIPAPVSAFWNDPFALRGRAA